MQLIHDVAQLRETVRAWKRAGQQVGLVPTMGNLHDGHISLVDQAREQAQRLVATVFVNPLQFGEGEDYQTYPRTLEADAERLRGHGVDVLFAPGVEAMYPSGLGSATRIVPPPELTEKLCGLARPGHFTGVATVVAKLLNLVQPDVAVFGKKDFQQLQVIRRMVLDLNLPVRVHGCETVREADGLAMSSRNAYLSAEERRQAPALGQTLRWVAEQLIAGADRSILEREAVARLKQAGLPAEYVSVLRATDLSPPRPEDAELVVLAAVRLGRARLIDNREVRLRH
ncbi:MAG: pantoate--beta-alanine ligase [Ectothiorhodospiraceae bacterium]|nr:pantoate--beta-alanine ligase [Ectothiorhodospiraceae bacterium]